MLTVDNIQDGEEVYQRCVLITGRIDAFEDSHVQISTLSNAGKTLFPDQQWPTCEGYFKALVMLSPGNNKLVFHTGHNKSFAPTLTLRYIPLLQTPPLHLAILIAKDSPLLIDCPPAKFAGLSTAHSTLDAAIAKFRITALMWQALTASEFRTYGLGRRAFRLEEEWTTDTLSSTYTHTHPIQSTPKIHLVRTDHTVADLRDAQRAQQNPTARSPDSLHQIFTAALKAHGAPFSTSHPSVVAGLILDTHFSLSPSHPSQSQPFSHPTPHPSPLILAHAALGAHNPRALSLGIFGSHTTFAWPRFIEEISSCLTDSTCPGDTVANDNGECGTMWEACAVGQGAFLHEVGHAFGAPHTTGIMERGYSPDWVRWFISRMATGRGKEGGEVVKRTEARDVGEQVEGENRNQCRWDVRDLLRFKALEEFMLPGDEEVDRAEPVFEMCDDGEGEEGGEFLGLRARCEAGIAVVMLNGVVEPVASVKKPVKMVRFRLAELEERFDTGKPLEVVVVGMNGREKKTDAWKFMNSKSWVRVPGTNIRLSKRAVGIDNSEQWSWAVMLKKRGRDGKLVAASKIDVRVGCLLDGAVVYYRDGTSVPCGPRGEHGEDDPSMGGHQAKKIAIRKGVEVAKIAVNAGNGNEGSLCGLRVWLSDGNARGALNKRDGNNEDIHVLVPENGHRIVGFYGCSGMPNSWGLCHKFGIITAPKNVELPDSVYDLEELQNNPERQRSKRRKIAVEDHSETEDDDSSISEDEDEGYDNESDVNEL